MYEIYVKILRSSCNNFTISRTKHWLHYMQNWITIMRYFTEILKPFINRYQFGSVFFSMMNDRPIGLTIFPQDDFIKKLDGSIMRKTLSKTSFFPLGKSSSFSNYRISLERKVHAPRTWVFFSKRLLRLFQSTFPKQLKFHVIYSSCSPHYHINKLINTWARCKVCCIQNWHLSFLITINKPVRYIFLIDVFKKLNSMGTQYFVA